MRQRIGVFVVAAVTLLALLASGVALAARDAPSVDDRMREIAAALRCPVCQNLSVADSPSQLAQQMRALIRERLVAGESREQIEAYFVSKYGEWVLLSPRRRGLNLLLWVGPLAGAALGLLLAARYLRRWVRRPVPAAGRAPEPVLLERVRAEVAREPAPASPEAAAGASPLERELLRLYEALRELAFDHRAGKLSTEDHEAMRADYEARAAAVLRERDVEPRPAPAPRTPARGRKPLRVALTAASLLVFGVALGVFLAQGLRPRGSSMDSITGDFLTGTGPGGISGTLSFRGNTVERNLAEGRAAFERGDYRMATDHFRSMLEVDPNEPTALSYLGMILSRGGHADAGLQAVDRALRTAPDHPLALWTKGLVLYEAKGDPDGAIRIWEALLRQPLAPPDADAVARMLAEARRQLATPATGLSSRAAPPAPAAERRLIAGAVTLSEGARGAGPVSGTLFVIARRGAGPPVAVKRIVEPKFPVSFVLGPEDVMQPGAELAGEVTLVARLKRDGRAGPAVRGDLEGAAPGPVAVGTTNARITLEAVR